MLFVVGGQGQKFAFGKIYKGKNVGLSSLKGNFFWGRIGRLLLALFFNYVIYGRALFGLWFFGWIFNAQKPDVRKFYKMYDCKT
jgi:hypothetical protein